MTMAQRVFPAGTKATSLVAENSIVDQEIDGQAGIRDYPWSYNQWHPKPDPTGPDCPQLADGVTVDGDAPVVRNSEIEQIAGTALVVKSNFGTIAELEHVRVKSAINGIRIDATDAQLEHVNVDNCVHDGLTVNGGGNVFIDTSHICGADRGFVFNQRVHARDLYPDSNRIGILLAGWSHMSTINGVEIGAGVNWERSIRIESTANTIVGITGNVRAADKEHPDIAGVELAAGTLQNFVQGGLLVPRGSRGFIVNAGDCNELHITSGGWWDANEQNPTDAVMLTLVGKHTRCKYLITGHGDTGVVIDARNAQLDETNEIEITWDGSAKLILGDTGKAIVTIHEVKK